MKKHNLFKIISIAILVFIVLSWIVPTGSVSGTEITKASELTRVGIIFAPFLYFYQNMVQVDIGSQFARMIYKMDNQETLFTDGSKLQHQ